MSESNEEWDAMFKSPVPQNRAEHLAKARNMIANLRTLDGHLWNYIGDEVVHSHLEAAIKRLESYDLTA